MRSIKRQDRALAYGWFFFFLVFTTNGTVRVEDEKLINGEKIAERERERKKKRCTIVGKQRFREMGMMEQSQRSQNQKNKKERKKVDNTLTTVC